MMILVGRCPPIVSCTFPIFSRSSVVLFVLLLSVRLFLLICGAECSEQQTGRYERCSEIDVQGGQHAAGGASVVAIIKGTVRAIRSVCWFN